MGAFDLLIVVRVRHILFAASTVKARVNGTWGKQNAWVFGAGGEPAHRWPKSTPRDNGKAYYQKSCNRSTQDEVKMMTITFLTKTTICLTEWELYE